MFALSYYSLHIFLKSLLVPIVVHSAVFDRFQVHFCSYGPVMPYSPLIIQICISGTTPVLDIQAF